MKRILTALMFAVILVTAGDAADAPKPADAAKAADWTDLVAGDMAKHWTTKGNWMLGSDGILTLTPRPGEKGWSRFDAYLWSKKTDYADFECSFDYKLEPKGNSGFYFHVGDVADPVNKGIEVQIYDSHGQTKFNDHTSGGVIPGIAPTKNPAKPAGEWNTMLVTVKGDKLTVSLNGEVNNEVDISKNDKLKARPKTGSIGIQDHGLPLAIRNVKIRELK